jgi:hypothetical protein
MADSRAPVVEDEIANLVAGSTTDRKNGSQESTLWREGEVAHRVDTSMYTMQASRIDAASHCVLAEAQAVQLPNRYDPMLSARDLRDRYIGPGDFSSHAGG